MPCPSSTLTFLWPALDLWPIHASSSHALNVLAGSSMIVWDAGLGSIVLAVVACCMLISVVLNKQSKVSHAAAYFQLFSEDA